MPRVGGLGNGSGGVVPSAVTVTFEALVRDAVALSMVREATTISAPVRVRLRTSLLPRWVRVVEVGLISTGILLPYRSPNPPLMSLNSGREA